MPSETTPAVRGTKADMYLSGARQRLEFLAKPLLSGPGPWPGQQCQLASPLYVALAFESDRQLP